VSVAEAPRERISEERPAVDTGLEALVTLLALHEIAADGDQIAREFGNGGEPLASFDLVRAARAKGLKARLTKANAKTVAQVGLPAIARQKDGSYVIIARANDEKVLVKEAGAPPAEWTLAQLDDRWSGELVLLARRASLGQIAGQFGLSWFLPAIVKFKGLLSEVVVASFFLQLLALVAPLFSQVVIDKVLVHRGLTTLDVLVVGLIVLGLFEVILGGLRTYVFAHTTSRVDSLLGARLFQHLVALPIAYFESRPTGQTVARVRELENIRNFLTSSALTLVLDLFFCIVFLAVMYWYSPTLTWIVLGSIPFYVALAVVVTPRLRALIEDKFQRGAHNQSFLVESIAGIETLKAMAVAPQMQRRWEESLAAYVQSSFKVVALGNWASQGVQLINKVTMGLILWFGAHLAIDGQMTVGEFVAFNMLAGQVTGPIIRLAQLWNDFQQFKISIDRLGDVLDTPTEPRPSAQPSLPPVRGRIRLEGVGFRYRPGGAEVLRDVTVEIPSGQVVGVVGRSGSGKSTLAKLLQRLHVPERGRVLVDGVDIALMDPAWLRRQIGVVLQENVLFNRSIRDNIALADPAMPIERIMRAAQLAAAHDFILETPYGYDTVLEERGSNLSGGQRQRIAIARALAGNPRILILDEATSALDYESEATIQRNMREIVRGKTVLMIAHRLSTVRRADRILVMERGQIIEDGPHDDLVKAGGADAKLVAQAGL